METTGISNNPNVSSEVQAFEQRQVTQERRSDEQKTVAADKRPAVVTPVEDVAKVEESSDSLDRLMEAYGLGVSFDKDSDTNRPVLKVYDRETQEIVKQFPNESALAAIKRLNDYLEVQTGLDKQEITGALFDEKI